MKTFFRRLIPPFAKFFFLWFSTWTFPLQAGTITLELGNVGTTTTGDNKTIPAVAINETFQLVITLTDVESNNIQIPGLQHFSLIGQSQGQEISTFNGKTSSRIHKTLVLSAQQAGDFTIGPVTLNNASAPIKSNTLSLRVVQNAQAVKRTQQSQQSTQMVHDLTGVSSAGEQPTVVCKLEAETTKVVVGQPIVLSASIYAIGPVLELVVHQNPTATGCMIKEIQASPRQDSTYDNKPCIRIDKKYVLIPLQQGAKPIQPLQVVYTAQMQAKRRRSRSFIDDFFQFMEPAVERRTAQSNDLSLNVSPIPPHQGPVDGTGHFSSFTATVDKTEVFTNDPVLLTLIVEGKGNLEHIATPKLALPDSFKYYDSKVSIHEDLATAYTGGRKQFEFIVQALQPGSLTIPTQTFTFYDVANKSFKTLKTNPITLTIKQRAGQSAIPTPPPITTQQEEPGSAAQQTNVQDINFIHENLPEHQQRPWKLPWWLFLFCLLVPALLFQQRLFSWLSGWMHKTHQRSHFRLEKELEALLKKGSAGQLYNFFIQLFAIQNNLNPEAISEDWIEQHLAHHSWEEKKINEFMDYLSTCARFHFSPQSVTADDHRHLLEKAQYWFILLTK